VIDRLRTSSRAAWLSAIALAADILLVTRSTDVYGGTGIPYWATWLALATAGVAVGLPLAARFRRSAPWLRPVEVLAIMAVSAAVLSDVTMAWEPLRDLGIYLKAGHHFMDGSPVYMQTPLTVQPLDRTNYPFLYPPATLPLFAALALLPEPVARVFWLAGSIALGLAALHLFGVPRRWLLPALLWPPLFQGLWVGNVAVPVLALFAAAPWLGAGLVLGAIFKPYTGIAALWLVLERRWLTLAAGVAAVGVVVLVTLPFTGTALWSDWLTGLGIYQQSQSSLPGLYGFGLPRFVPYAVYAGLAVAAVIAAVRSRGTAALARLGTATVVASPSLFGHGLLMAVPSILSLRAVWLWLAIGLLSTPDGLQWWFAVAVVAASWAVPAMRRPDGAWPRLTAAASSTEP
jgi:hypothetical protein